MHYRFLMRKVPLVYAPVVITSAPLASRVVLRLVLVTLEAKASIGAHLQDRFFGICIRGLQARVQCHCALASCV